MLRFSEERKLLKSRFSKDLVSDQMREIKQPPLEKPVENNNDLIDLPKVNSSIVKNNDIFNIIMERKSHRKFTDDIISLEELSFLLYTTQLTKEIKGDNYATIRPVPSAGARHPFETYLAINNVEGLKEGLYRYISLEHKLLFIKEIHNMKEKITLGSKKQKFVGNAPVIFIWTVIPYRTEWRYDKLSHKPILLDAGHLGHGLYLSCEALGLGTCAIAAYDQGKMDEILGLDGEEEFVIYLSPVGKV